MGPRYHLSLWACYAAWLAPELLVSMGPSPYLCFFHAKQRLLEQKYSLYGTQTPPVVLCMQISVISTRIVSLYGSQTSPVVVCMQNVVSWTRITCLYGFQPTSVVLCVENSDFRTKIACLHESRTSLVILCMQNKVPSFRITSPYGSCPHLWFLHAKQPLLYPNNKNLWVPDMTCRFMHAKKRD